MPYNNEEMFSFFESLKKEFNLPKQMLGVFQVVMISQEFMYIEGHKGILKMSEDNMTFRVKNGVLVVLGQNLILKELTSTTVAIMGKIKQFEVM